MKVLAIFKHDLNLWKNQRFPNSQILNLDTHLWSQLQCITWVNLSFTKPNLSSPAGIVVGQPRSCCLQHLGKGYRVWIEENTTYLSAEEKAPRSRMELARDPLPHQMVPAILYQEIVLFIFYCVLTLQYYQGCQHPACQHLGHGLHLLTLCVVCFVCLHMLEWFLKVWYWPKCGPPILA